MTNPAACPVFCTYFDHHYLSRGLALYHSLVEHCGTIELHVLCLSPECLAFLRDILLPGLIPISLEDFEKNEPRLAKAKSNRSLVEYYFTCSPFLPRYVLQHHPLAQGVVYLDSDMFCFAPLAEILEECLNWSVGLSPHRFPERLKGEEVHGRFNVGFLWFRNDRIGHQALHWWGEKCLEWCFDRVEPGRFADQKYLDEIPLLFPGVWEISHPGIDLAPWNLENSTISFKGSRIILDARFPLLVHHFHGVKKRRWGLWDLGLKVYPHRVSRDLLSHLFRPYIRSLQKWERWSLDRASFPVRDWGIRYAPPLLIDWEQPFHRLPRQFVKEFLAFWDLLRQRHYIYLPEAETSQGVK